MKPLFVYDNIKIRKVSAEVTLKDKKMIEPGMAQQYNIDKNGNGDTDMSRKFTDLTKDEIKFIVNELFSPKRITNIKISKKYEEITCTIYTEWNTTDDDGNEVIEVIPDEIELRNPFDYGENAIHAPFGLNYKDYAKLKSFCYAKGIYGASIEWLTNNPYMELNV